jgi:Thrombospondin type 1 domain.
LAVENCIKIPYQLYKKKYLIIKLSILGFSDESFSCVNWTKWSKCSSKCDGTDVQTRSRRCKNEDNDTTQECKQTRKCIANSCKEWSDWSAWASCTTQRSRVCRVKGTGQLVEGCSGGKKQVKRCNNCVPVWTQWSSWGSCSATCGKSTRSRSRRCVLQYSNIPSKGCKGSPVHLQSCKVSPCPSWAKWGSWSACSATCGNRATRIRSRNCVVNGVNRPTKDCIGASTQTQPCKVGLCPTWTSWSAWRPCSATCGSGAKRSRSRRCVLGGTNTPTNGCPGTHTQYLACKLPGCPIWTSWGGWGRCSKTCGSGATRTRSRRCVQQGSNIGTSGCPGTNINTQKCITKLCKFF